MEIPIIKTIPSDDGFIFVMEIRIHFSTVLYWKHFPDNVIWSL